jgi:hypothetical protein
MTNSEIAIVEQRATALDLTKTDPMASLLKAEEVVGYMAAKCTGTQFITEISGRKYPRVEWWTTVGLGLGIFPYLMSNERLDRNDELVYEASVEIRMNGQALCRGEAICSSREANWGDRDEYAIKSMAATRATGKAFRLGLSGLAVMAGLEATPAEEMSVSFLKPGQEPCPLHAGQVWFKSGRMKSPAHPVEGEKGVRGGKVWCDKMKLVDERWIPMLRERFKDDAGSAVDWARDQLAEAYPAESRAKWDLWTGAMWFAIEQVIILENQAAAQSAPTEPDGSQTPVEAETTHSGAATTANGDSVEVSPLGEAGEAEKPGAWV